MSLFDRLYAKCKWLFYKYIRNPYYVSKFGRNFNIANSDDTIDYIVKNRCSVSRFGDGEFDVIFGAGNGFQDYNEALAVRLTQVLQSNTAGHIVCIPYTLGDTSICVPLSVEFCGYFVANNYALLDRYLDKGKLYYDTQISRFYMSYRDKSGSKKRLESLLKIWQDRDLVIVEGDMTRSGIGNNLFSGARSIRRILAPSKNAFNSYDRILGAVKENAKPNDLILLSLGMTATVLAYDLHIAGYQAIDLGHLDIEYEWFKMGATSKVAIKNRFVNEVVGGDKVDKCEDHLYLSQIVADVSK